MRFLADANILARIAQRGHHQHQSALQSVKALVSDGHDPIIVPQVIYEFWVVATRPLLANGLGMSSSETLEGIETTKQIFNLLLDERAIFDRWERLIFDYDVRGKKAHDARIVAAMLRHQVSHILTFYAQDFAGYKEITVLTPERIA